MFSLQLLTVKCDVSLDKNFEKKIDSAHYMHIIYRERMINDFIIDKHRKLYIYPQTDR